jgi:hypothetical protein
MPSFQTLSPMPPPVAPGTYIAKVVAAAERVSEAGNDLIAMKLSLPDGRTLPCCLTFVERARPVLNAFAVSAGFLIPKESDVEVQLTAELCKGRYIYITIAIDQDSNGESAPKITRFLTRDAALLANPALGKITLQPQEPIPLPVVPRTQNLFK